MISRSQLTRKKEAKPREPKKVSCKVCKTKYVKLSMSHVACSPACAIEWAKRQREKREREAMRADRVVKRAKLEAMKTKPQLTKEAQKAFNKRIRARDAGKPCISCQKPMQHDSSAIGGGSHDVDCGHYRSVGSAPHLRFDERNAHAQCVHCNRYLAGNPVGYRAGLIERIGLAAVEALEADNDPKHYTHDDLRTIRRLNELQLTDLLAARAEGQAC